MPLARHELRAEGKSFVVKDGVNPLVAKLQPVVDAMNAPECKGLEAALRAIGGDVVDQDRTAARVLVTQCAEEVMAGDMQGKDAAVLG